MWQTPDGGECVMTFGWRNRIAAFIAALWLAMGSALAPAAAQQADLAAFRMSGHLAARGEGCS
jgi:hypothetical protein